MKTQKKFTNVTGKRNFTFSTKFNSNTTTIIVSFVPEPAALTLIVKALAKVYLSGVAISTMLANPDSYMALGADMLHVEQESLKCLEELKVAVQKILNIDSSSIGLLNQLDTDFVSGATRAVWQSCVLYLTEIQYNQTLIDSGLTIVKDSHLLIIKETWTEIHTLSQKAIDHVSLLKGIEDNSTLNDITILLRRLHNDTLELSQLLNSIKAGSNPGV